MVWFDRQTGLGFTNAHWEAITPEQCRWFAPMCPDFVLKLKSPTYELYSLQMKSVEYIENGAQLAWLIDPEAQQIHYYLPQMAVQILHRPQTLFGEKVSPGFAMALTLIRF